MSIELIYIPTPLCHDEKNNQLNETDKPLFLSLLQFLFAYVLPAFLLFGLNAQLQNLLRVLQPVLLLPLIHLPLVLLPVRVI